VGDSLVYFILVLIYILFGFAEFFFLYKDAKFLILNHFKTVYKITNFWQMLLNTEPKMLFGYN
jgi:hypothetical protein